MTPITSARLKGAATCGLLVVLTAAAPIATFAQQATPAPEGFVPEPGIIARAIDYADRTIGTGEEESAKNGFYPEMSHLPTGAGWITLGPGYRHWLFDDRAVIDTSAAISWRSYKMARVQFALPELARGRVEVGTETIWRDMTQITYFGTGPASPDTDRSEYRMKTTDIVAYATYRPRKWLSIGTRAGWLHAPTLLEPAGTFLRGNPDAATVFPDDPVYQRGKQPDFLYGGASLAIDTRDSRSRPSTGGLYRTAWTSYSDHDGGQFDNRQYEFEAAQFVPLAERRLVLGFHGWAVGTNTPEGSVVPFYLAPSLGGHNSLRAETDYRFHDRNMLVVNAEARMPLMTHVDLAAFADAGNVSSKFGNLNLDKRAFGVGLRLHSMRETIERVDVAYGSNGWQVFFRTSDPLHLSRLSRRNAAAPFVQ